MHDVCCLETDGEASNSRDLGSLRIRLMDSESLPGVSSRKSPICSKVLATYAILAALGVLPYANTLKNGFVYDDQYQVLGNPFLRSFHYLPTIFTTSVWDFQVKHGVVTYYRPMMTLAYLIFFKVFGPVPYGFHLANVLLNATIVFLFFALTRRLCNSEPIAWCATAVFALHPVHTEVVAWIAALPDLQLTIGLLAGFWFYMNLCDSREIRWKSFVGLCGAYVFSLLSKEPAVVFPIVMLAFELIRAHTRRAWQWRDTVQRQVPLWIMTALYLVLRFGLLRGIAPNRYRAGMPVREMLLSAFSLFGDYSNKLIWPAKLQAYYSFVPTVSVSDPRFLTGVGWLAAFGFLLLYLWRRRRVTSLGVIWLIAPLLPVLNAKVMASNVFAERYLYLPSIGFSWIVGEGFELLRHNVRVRAFRLGIATASIVLCTAAFYRVVSRNSQWRDEITLFLQSTAQDPENSTLHADLGAAYWNIRDEADAVAEWKLALAHDPDDPVALDNLGLFYLAHQKFGAAAGIFRKVIAIRPAFPTAHIHLAATLQYAGDLVGAESEYKSALDTAPLDWNTHNLYAKFCLQSGRSDVAETEYERSLEITPNPEALDNLAKFHASSGDPSTSERLFRESLNLDPYDYRAHLGLAEILARTGRTSEAIRHYQEGLQLNPADEIATSALKQLRLEGAR